MPPSNDSTTRFRAGCCIVGGGPAGMMLGLLLARAGIKVAVLEKHADFLRDFRGDTIHPSTLELISELGMLERFLARPHQEVLEIGVHIGKSRLTVADFRHVPTRCKFLGFMPQWDFLDFLAAEARRYPTFNLFMEAEVTDLMEQNGEVCGVSARTPEGELIVEAPLTVGCDGRHSKVRDLAGLLPDSYGAPMDVLWLRLSKKQADPEHLLFRVLPGRLFIQIDRGDYWQCAFAIPKGSFDSLRQDDISGFRAEIVTLAPHFADRASELASWDDVKLLTVRVDRLETWYLPGLLLIGDAAHAMSPVGGVGINLAIQDAVAAANILAVPLRSGPVPVELLAKVQKRRQWPTEMTQAIQARRVLFAGKSVDVTDAMATLMNNEFKGLKIVHMHATDAAVLHTRTKAVRTQADLSGMRIRVPGRYVGEAIKGLGGTPVGVALPEVYESLQRGQLDGMTINWAIMAPYKLQEVTKFSMDTPLYQNPIMTLMSQASYDKLPADLKTKLDELTAEWRAIDADR